GDLLGDPRLVARAGRLGRGLVGQLAVAVGVGQLEGGLLEVLRRGGRRLLGRLLAGGLALRARGVLVGRLRRLAGAGHAARAADPRARQPGAVGRALGAVARHLADVAARRGGVGLLGALSADDRVVRAVGVLGAVRAVFGCQHRRVDRLRRTLGEQHPEAGLRAAAGEVDRGLVGLAGQRDDDVLTALAGDLRLGDARGVDALPDHLDRLVDVAGGQLTATLDLWLQDDLGAALEVERQ